MKNTFFIPPWIRAGFITGILAVVFLSMMDSSFAQEGPRPAETQKGSEQRVLIGFKDGTGWQAAESRRTRVWESGGTVRYSYRFVPAVAAKLSKNQISRLRGDPRVAYIEEDGKVHALDAELDNSWGVKHIGAGNVHGYNQGTGIKVAIIDTGIDYTHVDLDDNYAGGYDFVNSDDDPMDDHGHGTHCAGIVAAEDNGGGVIGVAPKSSLYAVKVLNSAGSGYVSDVIAGIEWAIEGPDGTAGTGDEANIISMSLGSSSHSQALQNACDNAYNNGLLLVAAAGNDYSGWGWWEWDTVDYPAGYNSVIAVGATDKNNNKASWSSTGPALELAAPGVNIYSTYLNNRYNTMSGTSMACPHVVGVAALVWAGESLTNAQVRARLQNTADDLGDPGWDKWYGHGLVDADEAAPGALGEPPVAEAGGPYSGYEGSSITLDGSDSDDSDGTITTYEWDWESDGTYDVSTSLPAIEHTWNDDYSGTVTLRVTDDMGMKDTDTATVTVENVAPTAEAGGPYSRKEGGEITLSGSATDPGADTFTYAWDLDNNGSYETAGKSVKNVWASEGTYTVGFKVTDDDGGIGTDTATVNVSDVDPIAAFSYSPASPAPGDTIYFTDESTSYDGIISREWDFENDGIIDSTVKNPNHSYDSAGEYTVSFTVYEADGDSDMATAIVTVSEAPASVPDIDVSPTWIDFGDVVVDASSSPATVTVSNVGTANLTVGTIMIAGANADQFSIQNDNASNATIAPGGSATLKVVFSPTSETEKSAYLSIPSNDPDQPTVTVTLSGTGVLIPETEEFTFSGTIGSREEKRHTVTVAPSEATSMSVKLTWSGWADLVLRIYNPSGVLVKEVDQSNWRNKTEQTTIYNLSADNWEVAAYSKWGWSTTYTIEAIVNY